MEKNVAFKPFLLEICGVAGAGKTTLVKAGYVISLSLFYSFTHLSIFFISIFSFSVMV